MGTLADLDAEIAELESELAALKRARAIMTARRGMGHVDQSSAPLAPAQPAPASPEKEQEAQASDEKGLWLPELRKLMADGKKRRTGEIMNALGERGVVVSYSALTSWLGRAAKRGEFASPSRGEFRLRMEKKEKAPEEKPETNS